MKAVKGIIIILILTFSFTEAVGQVEEIKNWEFSQREFGGIWEVWRGISYDDRGIWNEVTTPHCFNAEDAVDPYKEYYQGEGWYKTAITINNPYKNGRTLIHFEGVGQRSTLYVYDQKVGNHRGGYDEYFMDITKEVANYKGDSTAFPRKKYREKIPLAVLADNTRDLHSIPSDLSDFNLYGGIYRKVWLKYVPAISLDKVHVMSTLDAKRKKAVITVKPILYNPENLTADLTYRLTVTGPNGKQLLKKKATSTMGASKEISFQISNPKLWSTTSPQLYSCELILESTHGTHSQTETFGLRDFRFEEKGPFYLNGKRLLLRGTHRHEDHAGEGAAMSDAQIREEFRLMQAMGVNFIRLGHYQQSELVLDLCDSLGILVWEEIPWCRSGSGSETRKEEIKTAMHNLIAQHYNHPSIIIWGVGNENDWWGEDQKLDTVAIRNYMQEIHEYAHFLDDSRMTAIRRCNFCKDIIDVYSPSIWAGWYRGIFTEYKNVSRMEMQEVDHFLHVEWGASHFTNRHSENPDKGIESVTKAQAADEREGDFLLKGGDARVSKDGDWSTTYACNLIDWHLKEQETMRWLTGTAYWPFKDFSTPLRPENPIPYVNQKGVLERDFTKKESYYVFQSYWTEKPMVHIYGSSWETRWGEEREQKLFKVYSNCDQVELFVNGISMGTKKRNSQDFPAAGLRWNITLKNGENLLRATGKRGEKTVTQEQVIKYQTEKWGDPANFQLKVIKQQGDSVLVEARLMDMSNIQCLEAKDFVRFDLAGQGELLDNQGTSTGSKRIALANGRAMIWMKKNRGESMVSVSWEPTIQKPNELKNIKTTFLHVK